MTSRPLALAAALLCLAPAACRTGAPAAPAAPSGGGAPAAGAGAVVQRRADGVELDGPDARVLVTVPAADTARVRVTRAGAFPTSSFAVDGAAAQASVPFQVEESADAVVVRTSALALRVTRQPLRVAMLDAGGAPIAEEAAPLAWKNKGALLSWRLPAGEHVYGLGDKVKGFDRRGQSFEMWNTDAYGWKADRDPLYKSIPFFLFLRDGRAHGLFVDSPSGAFADVGEADPALLTYEVDRAGAVDLYLFAGPGPKDVLASYTALTGRTPLPPRWALGYHQSRYSYETEAEAREVARRLRADRIPADAIWLDIDYQLEKRPFTVNPKSFPTFPKMVGDLRAEGLRTVVITDPHIAKVPGYAPYDGGMAADVFVHDPAGGPYVGDVWPGESVFPDFTLGRVRTWWGGLYRDFVGQGVAGFWNDMNEPAIFNNGKTLPADTPQRLDDGTTVEHAAVHNAYGALNARATYEGVRALRPGVRPFVLTRAAYAGAQRWAASWTGDNLATREHLALTTPTLTNLGASGYAFVGEDVGGFGGCPDPDLLDEWMELGAYHPFFRNHSDKKSCRREPWVSGPAHEARRRAAVERRYRLMPYLYTAFEETSRTGVPVMRPLWLEYPADPSTWTNDRAFLLGRDLLVAPKLEAGPAPYDVALPAGGWWDTRTGRRVAGGAAVKVTPAPDDSVRVFARAGAIVPSQPVIQHDGETPAGPLKVDVWPGPDCSGALYLDDGETFAFEQGALRRVAYACRASDAAVAVTASSTGAYPAWWRSTEVVVHGVPARPRAVTAAGGAAPAWRWDAAAHAAVVTLPGDASAWSVSVSW